MGDEGHLVIGNPINSISLSIAWIIEHPCKPFIKKSREFSIPLQGDSGNGTFEVMWRFELNSPEDKVLVSLKNLNWDIPSQPPIRIHWSCTWRPCYEISGNFSSHPDVQELARSASDKSVIIKPGQRLEKELCSLEELHKSVISAEGIVIDVHVQILIQESNEKVVLSDLYSTDASDEVFLPNYTRSSDMSPAYYSSTRSPFLSKKESGPIYPSHLNPSNYSVVPKPCLQDVGLSRAWHTLPRNKSRVAVAPVVKGYRQTPSPQLSSSGVSDLSCEGTTDLQDISRARKISVIDNSDKFEDFDNVEIDGNNDGRIDVDSITSDLSGTISTCGSEGRISCASSAAIYGLYCSSATKSKENYRERLREVVASSDRGALEDICAVQNYLDHLTVDNCLEALRMVDNFLPNAKVRVRILCFIRENIENILAKEQWTLFATKYPRLVKDIVNCMKQTTL
jgi:hypothetical protein